MCVSIDISCYEFKFLDNKEYLYFQSYLQRGERQIYEAIIEGRSRLEECLQVGIENNRIREQQREDSESDDNYVYPSQSVSSTYSSNTKRNRINNDASEYSKRRRKATNALEQKEEVALRLEEYIKLNFPQSKHTLRTIPTTRSILRPYLFDERTCNAIINTAWEGATADWNQKRFIEIIYHHWEFTTFINEDSKYYLPEFSVLLCLDLIKKQFNNIDDQIIEFIDIIFAWIDKKPPKQNTLCILGPPSCGKTFFTDSILGNTWNNGAAKPHNKWEQFPFEDCFDRRCILFNEASVSNDRVAIDKTKELLEGHDAPAARKYQLQGVIHRTPVIITANHPIWGAVSSERKVFEDRMFLYRWNTMPYLKEFKKLLNPKLWYYLAIFQELSYNIKQMIINTLPLIDNEIIECEYLFVNSDIVNYLRLPNNKIEFA